MLRPQSACLWIFQEFQAHSRNIRLRLECVITLNIPLRFFFTELGVCREAAVATLRPAELHVALGWSSSPLRPREWVLFPFCLVLKDTKVYRRSGRDQTWPQMTSPTFPAPHTPLEKNRTRHTLTQRLTVWLSNRFMCLCPFVSLV